MGADIPPCEDAAKLREQLSLVPARHREDALQEAWLAHLEGRCPIAAVWAYDKREERNDARHVPTDTTDDDLHDIAVDKDGTKYALVAPEQSDPSQSIPRAGKRRRKLAS